MNFELSERVREHLELLAFIGRQKPRRHRERRV